MGILYRVETNNIKPISINQKLFNVHIALLKKYLTKIKYINLFLFKCRQHILNLDDAINV